MQKVLSLILTCCYYHYNLSLVFTLLSRIIGIIIKEVENNIAKSTFLTNFRMGPLPTLCKKFVQLVEILVSVLEGIKLSPVGLLFSYFLL